MTALLPGDAASCSRLGGDLRRRAVLLLDACAEAERCSARMREGWAGRQSVATRRPLDATVAEARALAGELDRAGQVLQEHAADLASAQQQVGAVTAQVTARGGQLRDGRVHPAPVRPSGTPAQERDLADALTELQDRLDGILRRSRRAQGALAAALQPAQARRA